MSDTLRGKCAIESAKVSLVDEAIMTRTALDAAGVERMGKTVDLVKGDPRIQKLTALLDGTSAILTDIPSVDARFAIRLSCADEAERVIIGSKGFDEGIFVRVNDKSYKLPATFRSDLTALIR